MYERERMLSWISFDSFSIENAKCSMQFAHVEHLAQFAKHMLLMMISFLFFLGRQQKSGFDFFSLYLICFEEFDRIESSE